MRIHRVSIAVSSAIALLAVITFSGAPAAGTQPASTEDDTSEISDSDLLNQTVNDALVTTIGQLESAQLLGNDSPYANIVADTTLVDAETLEIAYWPFNGQAEEFLSDLQAVSDDLSMSVVPVRAEYNPAVTNGVAQYISTGPESALAELEAASVESVLIDTKTGTITVIVADSTGDSTSATIQGHSVTVDRNSSIDPQSRLDDASPWTGGAQLRGNTVLGNGPTCTAGFNWSKWGTNVKMGSTAEHCFRMTGNSKWYNWGAYVGNRYYYSVAADTTLLMSSPQGRFRPTVFIGNQTTGTVRWVATGMGSDPVGAAVALSGGKSGLHSGKVIDRTLYDGGSGPYRATSVNACLAGDSGSPWLSTQTSGRAVGWGQHGGILTMSSGVKYCYYMPVRQISAALAASLYVYTG